MLKIILFKLKHLEMPVTKRIRKTTKVELTPIEPSYEKVLVTPSMAEGFLSQNTKNRPLNRQTVNAFSKAMIRGEWRLTHQGIGFDTLGNLQDGQHRLHAIIESRTSQYIMIVKNLAVENFAVVDTGRLRTAAEVLYIDGVVSDAIAARQVAGITKFVVVYTTRNRYNAITLASNKSSGVTNELILEFVKGNKDLIQAQKFIMSIYRDFPKYLDVATLGGLYYIFSNKNKSKAEEFLKLYTSGANLPKDHPVLHLRNIFIRDFSSHIMKLKRQYKIALFIKAWNHFRSNENSIAKLEIKKGEKFPDIK